MTGKLRDHVLDRLGCDGPVPVSLAGLRRLYKAWCRTVPFDNIRKMIALRTGAALPGRDASDLFEHWLVSGAGGTCWAGANALFELLASLGFQARRAAGSMHDLGFPNHGTVIVTLGRVDWLADPSLLTEEPIPLAGSPYFHSNGVILADLECDARGHLLWTSSPNQHVPTACRLFESPFGHDFFLARYEESRRQGPFNHCLHARRNFAGRTVVLRGRTRFERTVDGIAAHTLSAEELCDVLHREIGISRSLISAWSRCGALAASLAPRAEACEPPATAAA